MEGLHGFIQGQSEEIIGHHSEAFTPFLLVQGLYILFSNLIGVVPGFESPTAVATVPLGCAVVAFFYYHAQGVRRYRGQCATCRTLPAPCLRWRF